MSYQIDRFNKTILSIVEDGTIDRTTDLKLIGKNYSGYGEIQNENFLFLLENFSGADQPPRPISGQIWFDSDSSKLKFFDGSKFRTTGGAEVSDIQPAGLTEGDFWWNNTAEQLYAYNGEEFVLIGPLLSGIGNTSITGDIVVDSLGGSHSIIKFTVDDTPLSIMSSEEFTLGQTIEGFSRIKKGITLRNTGTSGVTANDFVVWGTSSNTLKFDGRPASDYLLAGSAVFTAEATFPDAGITIGESGDLKIYIENGNVGIIQNTQGNSNEIKMRVNSAGGSALDPVVFNLQGILPGSNNTFNLGSSTAKWNTVYATLFEGTATSAKFADLAEIYRADNDYTPGTVVKLGGEAEITETTDEFDTNVFGVISTAPAHLMNADAEGLPVALQGRVPVKVIGKVAKGERLVSSPTPGYAWGIGNDAYDARCIIGRSLEDKLDGDPGLIEAVVGCN